MSTDDLNISFDESLGACYGKRHIVIEHDTARMYVSVAHAKKLLKELPTLIDRAEAFQFERKLKTTFQEESQHEPTS